MKFDHLKELITKAEVVSFDIFDTLIVRLYAKPTDLFRHLEESCKADGFHSARISAEMTARDAALQRQCHEVTLDEIYENLHASYQSLKEREIELEKLMCKANPEMLELFWWCKEQNKRIVISTDMYLPAVVIEEILGKAGYASYDKIFLSSETKHPKATGEMYEDLLAYCGTNAQQILHIGDNCYTDYEIAQQKGLMAYCYEPISKSVGDNSRSAYFALLNQYAEKEVVPSILKGMITLHAAQNPTENYWVTFGYQYAGVLTLSYVRWLHSQMQKDGIEQVFFMLRDGYIFKRAFDQLYPDIKTHEIYGSRSMFLLAGMERYEDIKMHITGTHRNGLTYRMCFERLSIKDDRLFKEYEIAFPRQDVIVDSEQEFNRIDEFFRSHESILKEQGALQRKEILEYFDSIGLLSGKNAIVDLGWKGSMLKGIQKVCKLENRKSDLYGYYLGTHAFKNTGIRAIGFAMNQGKPDDKYPIKALTDYGYTISVLEQMFSAPHPSILGVKKEGTTFLPIYQSICEEEEKRQKISAEILYGIQNFISDFQYVGSKFPVSVEANSGLIPVEYIATKISNYDKNNISSIHFFPGVGNDMTSHPIVRNGKIKFGIVFPWPGSTNAETEIILRIKRAAQENGMECVPIDNFGHILDDALCRTSKDEIISNPDFIITTHFETPKLLDTFYYHTLWNPPEYPLNEGYGDEVLNNYLMNDDYLIYDKGSMTNHLKSMLLSCPRTLKGASQLMSTFPKSAVMKANLSNPKIFYCGTNWDKMVTGKTRHEGLLKLMDNSGMLKIYGPDYVEGWGGVWPWEGYQCYQHPIPFDGFSLLKELNQCGICLVISSDVHRRAGAVTNRAFEACAAGAVIISDNNYLMKEIFGDAALFVDYNRNNLQDTYNQIVEKYNWILQNREEAEKMAKRAQDIFLEKYSLDRFLKNIVNNHYKRTQVIANDLYAKGDDGKVLVAYVCATLSLEDAKRKVAKVLQNVSHQAYRNILPVIAVDHAIASAISAFCSTTYDRAVVVPMEIFDQFGVPLLTHGQAISALRKTYEHAYYVSTRSNEVWFYDHITTMVRAIQDNNADISYSGQLFIDCNGYTQVHKYDTLYEQDLLNFEKDITDLHTADYPLPGCFMFTSNCHQYVPDYVFDCIDGKEHIAYLHLLYIKHKKKAIFTKRMTFKFDSIDRDRTNLLLDYKREHRFILDLSRFDRLKITVNGTEQQSSSQANAIHKQSLIEFASLFPIKPYLRMRYYRMRLRKLSPSSPKGTKYEKKYAEAKAIFNMLLGGKA